MGVHRRISHDRNDDGLAAAFVNDDRSELKAGSLDAVVAWHPDRLHRSPCELENFIDLVDATGATKRNERLRLDQVPWTLPDDVARMARPRGLG
jgi:hypothetical protein